MIDWQDSTKGDSGIWFKPGLSNDGKQHLLVSSNSAGVDHGSHDHYWKNNDGTYGVQIKNQNSSNTIDDKGHLYSHNTSFPEIEGEHLDRLFNRFF